MTEAEALIEDLCTALCPSNVDGREAVELIDHAQSYLKRDKRPVRRKLKLVFDRDAR